MAKQPAIGTIAKGTATSSSISLSVTVPSTNPRVVVGLWVLAASNPVTAITCGGATGSLLENADIGPGVRRLLLYEFIAPTPGSQTVAVTFSGSTDYVIIAVPVQDSPQTGATAVHGESTNNGAGTTFSHALTSTKIACLHLSFFQANDTRGAGASTTELDDQTFNGSVGLSVYRNTTDLEARASSTLNFTCGNSVRSSVALMLEPVLTTEEFLADDTFVVPSGVDLIEVEGWAGGGGGVTGGGGGGGSAYGRITKSVSPSNSFAIVVGQGGSPGNPGTNSTFNSTDLVVDSGKADSFADGPNTSSHGGLTANTTADVKFAGGTGDKNGGGNRGGGGSAGSAGAGGNTTHNGGSGGVAGTPDGAAGGYGNGSNGSDPGAGAGSGNSSAGTGGAGKVKVTYVEQPIVEKEVSDTLAMTDSTVKSLSRTISETLAMTDVATAIRVFSQEVSDTLAMTDSIVKSLSRTILDTITTATTEVKSVGKVISDSLTMTDTVTSLVTFIREISDSLALTDSVSRVGTFIRTASDSINVTDIALAFNLWTERTKPTTNWTPRTPPSSNWTNRTKPPTSWFN